MLLQRLQKKTFSQSVPKSFGSLWDKAGRAGRLEVMREVVYDMLRTLRVGIIQERQEFNSETQATLKSDLQSVLIQVPDRFPSFQALREKLEMSSAGEQLYRLRRCVVLAQFYNNYTNAEANLQEFLYPEQNKELSVKSLPATRKRKRASLSYGAKRRGSKLLTLVHNHIVDLMFPNLVLSDEDTVSEEAKHPRDLSCTLFCHPQSPFPSASQNRKMLP